MKGFSCKMLLQPPEAKFFKSDGERGMYKRPTSKNVAVPVVSDKTCTYPVLLAAEVGMVGKHTASSNICPSPINNPYFINNI